MKPDTSGLVLLRWQEQRERQLTLSPASSHHWKRARAAKRLDRFAANRRTTDCRCATSLMTRRQPERTRRSWRRPAQSRKGRGADRDNPAKQVLESMQTVLRPSVGRAGRLRHRESLSPTTSGRSPCCLFRGNLTRCAWQKLDYTCTHPASPCRQFTCAGGESLGGRRDRCPAEPSQEDAGGHPPRGGASEKGNCLRLAGQKAKPRYFQNAVQHQPRSVCCSLGQMSQPDPQRPGLPNL